MLIPEPPRGWDEQWASASARGQDGGPWSHWLPWAWQCLADPQGERPCPQWATGEFDAEPPEIAFWGPLLHICLYALGWVNPVQGLARWTEAGRPTDDARLALIQRWWGDHLDPFIAWGLRSPMAHEVAADIAGTLGVTRPVMSGHWASTVAMRRLLDRSAELHASDPLHLSVHASSPVTPSQGAVRLWTDNSRDALLYLSDYQGWYRTLHHLGSQLPAPRGGPWRVTVVCAPVGVLSTYRLSTETGRWFAGQHRWHQLGWRDSPPNS